MTIYHEITGVGAERPDGMNTKAQLSWSYWFEGHGHVCIQTDDDAFIVMDERRDLRHAMVFPDCDALIGWLEATADEYMEDDPVGYLDIALDPLAPGLKDLIMRNIAVRTSLIDSIKAGR